MEEANWHRAKERLHAQEEIRKFEREQALERITMLMRQHEIRLDELASLMRAKASAIIQTFHSNNVEKTDVTHKS